MPSIPAKSAAQAAPPRPRSGSRFHRRPARVRLSRILPALALALGAGLASGGGVAPLQAQQPQASGAMTFESWHLDNGLHVILAPDPDATATAVNLWYRVGSRDERPGRSGFAHLFEHLMFQGSENVAPGEHFQYVERAGGNLNASITEDRTNYFQTVPPERMNLALWLEADRMRSLRVTEENMRREVEVVKEERRRSVDNAPYGTTQLAASYYAPYDAEGCFAYAHSVIGSLEDLDAAELPDVQEFFDLYYAPNNATLVIAGAFDAGEARSLVESHFASIPRAADPPDVTCERPFAHLPVVERIQDPNAQLTGVFVSYGGVEQRHPDAAALTVLADILGGGQSARLNQTLVRDAQAALQASAFHVPRLGPGLFRFILIANQGVEGDELLALLDEQVERIRIEGVAEAEVARARNRALSSTVMSRQTAMGRAEALQTANHFHGTPEAVATVVEAIQAVTPADVQRVARSYLDPENRAVIFTIPGTGDDR
jgi:zinc protease